MVAPTDLTVLAPSTVPELTLTTCTPRYSAAQRLVVVARLVSPAARGRPFRPRIRSGRQRSRDPAGRRLGVAGGLGPGLSEHWWPWWWWPAAASRAGRAVAGPARGRARGPGASVLPLRGGQRPLAGQLLTPTEPSRPVPGRTARSETSRVPDTAPGRLKGRGRRSAVCRAALRIQSRSPRTDALCLRLRPCPPEAPHGDEGPPRRQGRQPGRNDLGTRAARPARLHHRNHRLSCLYGGGMARGVDRRGGQGTGPAGEEDGEADRRPERPAAGVGPVRRQVLHARDDGHGPQPWPQRPVGRGPGQADRRRAVRLRLLPPLHRHVRPHRAGHPR